MNKHLIAIDSDGTLKNSEGKITERTSYIINKIIKEGHYVVICTARPRYHAVDISKKLNLSNYIISSNGAEVYDRLIDKVIYSKYISKALVKKIYDSAREYNIRTVYACDGIEYATQRIVNESQILLDDNNIAELLNSKIKHIIIVDDKIELVDKYREYVVKKFKAYIADKSSYKDYNCFTITNRLTSKGNALKFLTKYLDISKSNIIAIGNDNNDISMIKYAKIGLAVDNSTDYLKKVADKIIPSNDDEGVYQFLYEWNNKTNNY